ncbi:hypothetical protein [Shewanella kaireitica]|uniref:hypothetical protein n=1 Tax=Shewanella kaireitica TaxID=212021 RepID=UPI00200EB01F|nr:hypothetical protein [Shewanella kaireitica]MCL1093666.1 hypothetical protein [Shewanella kaireitica]
MKAKWKLFKKWSSRFFQWAASLIANPVVNFLVTALQLGLGAMLGFRYSQIPQGTQDSISFMLNAMPSGEIAYLACTIGASLAKAGGDGLDSYFTLKNDAKRRENDRLIPEGKWFATTYAKTVRDVIDARYLIESGECKPLDVMHETLKSVRELAAQYDNSAIDSISVNLMLSLLNDEVEGEIEKNWENCQAFFDGSNAEAAISQIDGVLTPIAVAHADNKSKLYIGSGERRVKPLLLPIVDGNKPDKKNTAQRVIGAPRAFTTETFQYYGNFLVSVEEWLYKEQCRVISDEQADTLYKYYINDGSARSLLSVPIQAQYAMENSNGEELEDKPINLVLNVYASHENLLRGEPQIFLGLAQPLLDTIAFAFDNWRLELKDD